jgi:hypothetical protein
MSGRGTVFAGVYEPYGLFFRHYSVVCYFSTQLGTQAQDSCKMYASVGINPSNLTAPLTACWIEFGISVGMSVFRTCPHYVGWA